MTRALAQSQRPAADSGAQFDLVEGKPRVARMSDLLCALGDIPMDRIFATPPPGTATIRDVVKHNEQKGFAVELIDRTLVEKPVGTFEDVVASAINFAVYGFVKEHKLGWVGGSKGMWKMQKGNVRLPDVCFISRGRYSLAKLRATAVPPIAPDLSIEVLSASNTPKEMLRKRRELFASGTLLVWEFDVKTERIAVYVEAEKPVQTLDRNATLTGGAVLPGFKLSLAKFWASFEDD